MTSYFGPGTRGVPHLVCHLYAGQTNGEHIPAVAAERNTQPARANATAWAAIWRATFVQLGAHHD